MNTFNIEWRSQEGYGDFITGLCYAHSSVLKYQRPVHIHFHWPNPKHSLLSKLDKETIFYRFEHIREWLRPIEGLTITHQFSSVPPYRFVNELEEFNPLHGLWYPKNTTVVEDRLVMFWSSKHNITFPGLHKDPAINLWDKVTDRLKREGYNVVEVTYRTPVVEVMDLINRCEFGLGYEGMVHQLFKFMWKPLVVCTRRLKLNTLLIPQAHTVVDPGELLGNIETLVSKSKNNIERLKVEHNSYIMDKQDPTKHKLYNLPILTN